MEGRSGGGSKERGEKREEDIDQIIQHVLDHDLSCYPKTEFPPTSWPRTTDGTHTQASATNPTICSPMLTTVPYE